MCSVSNVQGKIFYPRCPYKCLLVNMKRTIPSSVVTGENPVFDVEKRVYGVIM